MGAVLALIPNWLKIAAAGLMGAILLTTGAYTLGKHDGRQAVAVEAAEATAQALKDRADENATVDSFDRRRLCLDLGGLPDDCSKL